MSKFKTGLQIHKQLLRESSGAKRMDYTIIGQTMYISKGLLYKVLDEMVENWNTLDFTKELKKRLESDKHGKNTNRVSRTKNR